MGGASAPLPIIHQCPRLPRRPFPHSQTPVVPPTCLFLSSPGSSRRPPTPLSPRCFLSPNPRAKQRATTVSMAMPRSDPAFDSGTTNDEEPKTSSHGVIGNNDLLIVGPGVLGRIVAEKWQQAHPGCQVFGQTLTTDHHDELIRVGINPCLRGSKIGQFPYVILCAPPSRSVDYPGDVRLAASNWSTEGSFLFTSSSAVFDCSNNGSCPEDFPVVPIGRSPRIDVMLKAEKEALDAGGCVLRLAGLYKLDRGAHVYWLRKGSVDSRPDHIVNLIHYEDAASLVIAILKKQLRGRIFLGCDDHPLSRQEIMDSVVRSGKFSKAFQGFTGTNDPLGKRLNNSKTRAEIGWQPKYPSFPHFLGLQE